MQVGEARIFLPPRVFPSPPAYNGAHPKVFPVKIATIQGRIVLAIVLVGAIPLSPIAGTALSP